MTPGKTGGLSGEISRRRRHHPKPPEATTPLTASGRKPISLPLYAKGKVEGQP